MVSDTSTHLRLHAGASVAQCGSIVEGGFDGESAALEDMGVDHGGFDILVSEEFLNGADIVSVLEEVGGEGVAKGVGGDLLVDACDFCGFTNGFLGNGFVKMMAADDRQ